MCAHYILQIERRNKKVSLMRMTEQKKKEKKETLQDRCIDKERVKRVEIQKGDTSPIFCFIRANERSNSP
jgi:uncharacterized protein (DUF1015 family)